jgi:hypothetical protein
LLRSINSQTLVSSSRRCSTLVGAHSEFNRNRAPATDHSSRQQTAAMSMLRSSNREKHAPENFLMQ